MPDTNEPDMDDLIRLSVFSSIAKSIVSERSIRGVLDRVMEHVASFFGPLNWSLLLVDAQRSELVFARAVGRTGEGLVGERLPLSEGIAGWVASRGTPAVVEDTASDSRFSERMDGKTGFRTESVIAVPLRSGDKVFGVIELLNRLDGRAFSAYDMRVLSAIADFAAIAVEKAYYLAESRRLSELDPLTGALNRRGLAKVVERETSRLARYGGSLSILLADIDKFKAINDSLGHAAGDEALKSVAAALMGAVRKADSVARYGGDEFLVVMPQTGPEDAEIARIRLSEVLKKAGEEGPVRFSVTLGAHTSQDVDFDEIFRGSDRDLYRRKGGPLALGENLLAALDAEESARAPDQGGSEE